MNYPVKGTGLFWIEHIVPRSVDKSLANVYANCVYSCKFCNRSRWYSQLKDELGRQLITPEHVAWADHFDAIDDKLVPKTGDAEFTGQKLYRVNDVFKIERRRERREVIAECLEVLEKAPREIERYLEIARRNASRDGDEYRQDAKSALDAAAMWEGLLRKNRKTLDRYRLVPTKARCPCSCGEQAPKPPPHLDAQGIVVEH